MVFKQYVATKWVIIRFFRDVITFNLFVYNHTQINAWCVCWIVLPVQKVLGLVACLLTLFN